MKKDISRPIAWADKYGNLCTDTNKEHMLTSRWAEDYAKYTKPVYSEEYVDHLISERDKNGWYVRECSRLSRLLEINGVKDPEETL